MAGSAFAGDTSDRETLEPRPDEHVEAPASTVGIAPIPIVYYTPETSLALGAGVVLTFRDLDAPDTQRPDSLQILAVYTFKHQAYLSLTPQLFFNDDKGSFEVATSYAKWPSSFFGVANEADIDAQDIEDLEESYMSESFMIQPSVSHKIVSDFALGVTADYKQNTISDAEAGGLIDQGRLEGHDGGTRSGIGPLFSWDTRNHLFYPTEGSWFRLWSWHYRETMGSDFDYDLAGFDMRTYLPLAENRVLALQGIGIFTDGEMPFNELPTPVIRGLYQNVFVDDHMVTLQAEYRFPIKNRWSGVAFAALGDVFHETQDYDIKDIKYGAGAGIRWAISTREKINLRFDIGISRYGVFPYLMFQEAF